MASLVDSGVDTFDKSSAASVTLGAAPSAQSLLVCGVVWLGQGADTSTINNSLADSGEGKVDFGTDGSLRLYVKFCDGTESATTSYQLDTGGSNGSIWVAEYSLGGPTKDQSQNDTQTGVTTASAATYGSVPSLNITLVGVESATVTFSNPSSGWAIANQNNGSGHSICGYHALAGVTTEGTVDMDETLDFGAIGFSTHVLNWVRHREAG